METDKRYKITLSDGTELDNLRLNGYNYISAVKPDDAVFDGNCSPVLISDGEEEIRHENMELVQIVEQNPGEYWFVLRDISDEELEKMQMQSNIEYLAMMSSVEL